MEKTKKHTFLLHAPICPKCHITLEADYVYRNNLGDFVDIVYFHDHATKCLNSGKSFKPPTIELEETTKF